MDSETTLFLRELFAACEPKEAPLYLTLTAIHPDATHPTPSRHIPLHNEPALNTILAQLFAANARGWGAYFGVAPRVRDLGRWSRGGKGDLTMLPALYIDLDQPDDALFQFIRFALPPTAIVCSGKGYHAYWFLEEPTQEFAEADNLLHGLAKEFMSDDKMSVAQSMCMLRGISLRWIHIHRNGEGRILPSPWEKAKVCAAEGRTGSLSAMR